MSTKFKISQPDRKDYNLKVSVMSRNATREVADRETREGRRESFDNISVMFYKKYTKNYKSRNIH